MNIVCKRFAGCAVAVAVVLMLGCSPSATPVAGDTPTAAKPAAPATLVSAKTAFNPMYTSAVRWAPDVVLLRVNPKSVPGFTNEGGKAAMWEAAFASPSLHKYRVDTYAITTVLPSIHKGGSAGMPMLGRCIA